MENTLLEIEFIDSDSRGTALKMNDGKIITIGKNAENFYHKLIDLPISYKCQLLNVELNDLASFIKESQISYNSQLISLFGKKWVWKLDSEVYDFSDKETNEDFFNLFLDKKQIVSKLKRNTFHTDQIFRMLDFFKNNEEIKEKELED